MGGRGTSAGQAGGGSPGGRDQVTFFVHRLPSSLDPTGWDGREVMAQIFERLTDIDTHSNVVPALAQSWTADPGGRRFVFTLRPGLQFSDGTPLAAADVVRSWMRLLDPDRYAPFGWLLYDVEGAVSHLYGGSGPVGIVATDPRHVEVRLSHPANDFPTIAATPWLGVVPPSVTSSVSELVATQTASSGGYRVESRNQDEMVLVANPHYWAGAPPIHQVRLTAGLADRGPVQAFLDDKVDYAPVPESDAAWIATDPELGPQLIEEPVPSVALLGFSATKPPFDDPRVRKAFAEAVDWKRVVALGGYPATPARGFVPPGIPGRSEIDSSPRYDPAEARSLLAQAGFPGGDGFPSVTMTSEGYRWDPLLVESWRSELGVEVRAEEVFDLDYVYRLVTDPPAIWTAQWSMDYPAPNDFLGVLAGLGQPNNYSKWSSSEFDDAIQAARAAGDPAQARAAFERAAAILRDEVPMVAVSYQPAEWVLARSGLVGTGRSGLGFVRLAGLAWTGP
jgi:oligopeptide transport system substrate-binding protein